MGEHETNGKYIVLIVNHCQLIDWDDATGCNFGIFLELFDIRFYNWLRKVI